MRLLIIGLDGITWNVVDPLLDQGRLPNLAHLIENGARGVSTAIEPALSPIVWTSIASGKLPKKHGVTHFFDTAKSVRCRRLWDILSDQTIGLFSWPITWPPQPINGFMIPSLFARDNATYPPELHFIKDLEQGMQAGMRERVSLISTAMRHGLRPSTVAHIGKYALNSKLGRYNELDRFIEQRLLKLDVHLDLFEHLAQAYQPQFASFYMNQTDAFAHRFWRFYEPERFADVSPEDIHRYGDVIPEIYETADRAVGRLLKLAGPETLIAVISDHGFEAAQSAPQENGDGRQFTGRALGQKLLDALNLGEHGIYVNHRHYVILKLDQTNGSRQRVIEQIEAFHVQELDTPLLKAGENETGEIVVWVHRETEDALIDADPSALHIDYLGQDLEIPVMSFLDMVQPQFDTRMSGVHHPDGVAIWSGPNIEVGAQVEKGSVLDIVPTILALQGRPIGRDMDGRALTEVIKPEFLRENPLTYIDTYDTDTDLDETHDGPEVTEELMTRLRALGYVN